MDREDLHFLLLQELGCRAQALEGAQTRCRSLSTSPPSTTAYSQQGSLPSGNILPQILHSPSINSWHLLIQNRYSVLFTKKFKSLAAHKDQNQMPWFTSSSQSQRKCGKKKPQTPEITSRHSLCLELSKGMQIKNLANYFKKPQERSQGSCPCPQPRSC